MSSTLYDNLSRNFIKYPNKPAIDILTQNSIKSITYQRMEKMILHTASMLKTNGVKRGDNVVILGENRAEWYICSFAIFSIGAVCVPLYITASEVQQNFILSDCAPKFAFISKSKYLSKIEKNLKEMDIQFLLFDNDSTLSLNFSVTTPPTDFKRPKIDSSPSPNDVAAIIYTSGTTGNPKGVMLTHSNITSNIEMIEEFASSLKKLRYLSILPLSHAYEFTIFNTIFSCGGTVIPVPNIARVVDYISKTSPTLSCGVPRLFEKIYATVLNKVKKKHSFIRYFFNRGLKIGDIIHKNLEKGTPIPFPLNLEYKFYNWMIFSKIKRNSLKSIELFVSGGAALRAEVSKFFTIIGVRILEGYGITECSPIISFNKFDDIDIGTVGYPGKNIRIGILQDGELIVKGPTIMKGYYKSEHDTKKVIDDEGFFHTGDIAVWTDNGKLKIVDRKKEMKILRRPLMHGMSYLK